MRSRPHLPGTGRPRPGRQQVIEEKPFMTEPVRLDPAQRGRTVETLVRAFRDDPAYTYVFPDEADRVRSLRGLWDATIRFSLVYGEAWTTPEVSGVACWLSPGNAELTFWRLLRTGFALPWTMMRFEGGARRRAMGLVGYLDEKHRRAMHGPHWYLWALGVEPAAQGQGIGGSLIRPVLARADAEGLPCYLETETERNVAFYRKYGFEVVTAEVVPGHGLMLWTLSRGPRH
jgi:ribosomal protein S18 acetylase RimI-like enzyme